MKTPLLDQLQTFVDPIDGQLARRIAEIAARERPAAAEKIGFAAGLCGFWRAQGHACLPLSDLPRRLTSRRREGFLLLPTGAELAEALTSSMLVSSGAAALEDGAKPTPLVLDDKGRLYLWRYFQAEKRLARKLRELAARPSAEIDTSRIGPLFRRLFPQAESDDAQAVAAAASLLRPLWLICGGPGTGKTTTVAKLLALELEGRDLRPKIALAAPTGKAATRLIESLSQQIEGLELAPELKKYLPRQAATLHRLLGYSPRQESFQFRPGNPLPFDLLVVDEASMVDLLLMDSLFAALPPQGKIVLLGDKDQLASVETGSVFGDLSAAAIGGGLSARSREALAPLLGEGLPEENEALLADTAIELWRSYRFEDQPGIGRLAEAIKKRNVGAALEVLQEGRDDVGLRTHTNDPAALLATFEEAIQRYLAAKGPAEALAELGKFRLLCVLRGGPWGVENMNREVERHLLRRYRLDTTRRWYQGRPILVRANDYEAELWNGDLGVVWEEEGQSWAFFPQPGQAPRRLTLAKLPVHETAWAMTVHQSQGSELDHVLFVLPAEDHPLLGRELLYTGVTRARKRVDLVGEEGLIEEAIERENRRISGLLDALLEPAESIPSAP